MSIDRPKAVREVDLGVTPIISTLTMTTASTEYSFDLPAAVTRFTVQPRLEVDVQMAVVSGSSGSDYFNIPSGTTLEETEILTDDTLSLYFQSNTASQILNIFYWKNTT